MSLKEYHKSPLKYGIAKPFGMRDPHGDYSLKVPSMPVLGKLHTVPLVSENSLLFVMQQQQKDIVEAAKVASENAKTMFKNKELGFGLVFDCDLRKRALDKDVHKEIDALKKYMKNTPFIGFYSGGEFGGVKGRKMGYYSITASVYLSSSELM